MQPLIYLLSILMMTLFFNAKVTATEAKCVSLTQLDWLLGSWQTLPNGNTQEQWWQISEDTYTGAGRSRNVEGKLQQNESMRLVAMQHEVFYLAKVGHNSLPVPFRAKNCTVNTVTFENPTHDFPNEITYQRSENTILVNVSGLNGKGFKVQYALVNEQ